MRALVALGSNLGDRRAHLEAAWPFCASWATVTALSPMDRDPRRIRQGPRLPQHRGPPGNRPGRPRALLEALLRAELRRGRDRSVGRNAPRTLDLDLIPAGGAEGLWTLARAAGLEALGPN